MDYKYRIQQFAEQLAEELHGCEFYNLTTQLQDEVYGQAVEMYKDEYTDMIDMQCERRKYEKR